MDVPAQNPLPTTYTVFFFTSIILNCILLIISVISTQLDATRWHSINIFVWMIIHTMTSVDCSPWSPWQHTVFKIPTDGMCADLQMFCLSVIPAGNTVLLIESLMVTFTDVCGPNRGKISRRVHSAIWLLIMIVVYNVAQLLFVYAKYGIKYSVMVWWYDPIKTFHVATAVISFIMSFVYVIFAIVLSCCVPIARTVKKKERKKTAALTKMWFVFLYVQLPELLLVPYQSMSIGALILDRFSSQIQEQMMTIQLTPPSETKIKMINIMLNFLGYRETFVLIVPTLVPVLAIVCRPFLKRTVTSYWRFCVGIRGRRSSQKIAPIDEKVDCAAKDSLADSKAA